MDSWQQLQIALPIEKLVGLVDNLFTFIEEAIQSPCLDFCHPSLSNED